MGFNKYIPVILGFIIFSCLAVTCASSDEQTLEQPVDNNGIPYHRSRRAEADSSEDSGTNPEKDIEGSEDEKQNCTAAGNTTMCKNVSSTNYGQNSWAKTLDENRGMMMRTFYVFIGVAAIVIVYFVVRTIR